MADENKQIKERNRQANKQRSRQQEEERRQASEQRSAERIGMLNEERRQAIIAYLLAEEERLAKIRAEQKLHDDMQPNAVNKQTSTLLKAAWENLILSWGATLIWIDIHIFAGLVMGNKLFCKLGMEWVPDFIKQTKFKEAEKIGNRIGFYEGAGVACLNLGCLLIIIVICMIVAMLLKVVENPIAFFGEFIKWMWSATTNAISAWVKS